MRYLTASHNIPSRISGNSWENLIWRELIVTHYSRDAVSCRLAIQYIRDLEDVLSESQGHGQQVQPPWQAPCAPPSPAWGLAGAAAGILEGGVGVEAPSDAPQTTYDAVYAPHCKGMRRKCVRPTMPREQPFNGVLSSIFQHTKALPARRRGAAGSHALELTPLPTPPLRRRASRYSKHPCKMRRRRRHRLTVESCICCPFPLL